MNLLFIVKSGPHTGRLARIVILALAAALAPFSSLAESSESRATHYISPNGNDANPGSTAGTPVRSFLAAFRKMRPGDELVLLDGHYSEEAGTGAITYSDYGRKVGGPHSEQIPGGRDRHHPTVVRALNPGRVFVDGALIVGRSFRKDSFIRVEGITFVGGGNLYNTSHVTIKNCGFQGSFGIGTNDHKEGNDHNLIEDVWIWAAGERIIAANYRSDFNVWRRVLVRGDGCGQSGCQGSGNPNVGITVYDSSNVSLQNVMVVDRILLRGDEPYADFAVAQHTPGAHFFGRSEWLGTISLRSPDTGYYMEPDSGGTIDPTILIRNAVAWDSTYAGINLSRAGTNNRIENVTVYARGGDGVRVAPVLTTGEVRNALVVNSGRYGINSAYPSSHVNVHGSKAQAFEQRSCTKSCYSSNPRSDGPRPSLRYLLRIEPGSFLSGKGVGGGDIGANIVYRYGKDGSIHGDVGFNVLTTTPLWPWPNQERIRAEMCEDSRIARGFCQSESLTRYLWEYLGNSVPSETYNTRVIPKK
jgi:hypothetical protein